jgi:signal transduction histidine kinase
LQQAFLWGFGALALLSVGAGLLVARRILRRVDAATETSRVIMAGDLSRRMPVEGSGDEFDRLAQSVNAMLERIEQLMAGLREVSDNIAHALKTPLTRLRTRAEAALRDPRGQAACREGLERTIEEADELIRTFNALLAIARLEAGAGAEAQECVDLAAIASDVAELYGPVAEEAGLALLLNAHEPAPIQANRQLVSQAIANLVDNAIKYSGCGASAERSRGGGYRGRPGAGHPRGSTRPRPQALRAPGSEPVAAGERIGVEPGGSCCAHAWGCGTARG